jgi:hypothetical protein
VGLRHDAHPLIQFLDGPSGRPAGLLGRGLDVWEIIATIRDNNGSMVEAAEYLQIPAGLVEAAVAYYDEYQGEVDGKWGSTRRSTNAGGGRHSALLSALLDEQLSPQIAVLLREAGYDVHAVAGREDLAGAQRPGHLRGRMQRRPDRGHEQHQGLPSACG